MCNNDSDDSESSERYACPWDGCDRSLPTESGLKCHHARVHGESIAGVVLECEVCGDSFRTPSSRKDISRFCSLDCTNEWKKGPKPSQRTRVEKTCETCGDSYEVIPSRAESSRYCSNECTRTQVEMSCDWCGCSITVRASRANQNHQFCGLDCRNEWMASDTSPWGTPRVTKSCEQCGSSYDVRESQSENRRFCSHDCAYKGKRVTRVPKECHWCGGEFEVLPSSSSQRFCGTTCKYEWHSDASSGPANPNWGGGKPKYYGKNWHRQRRAAIQRDGKRCCLCNLHRAWHGLVFDEDIHVHHIRKIAQYDTPEDANDLSNLLTVCRRCHGHVEEYSPLSPDIRT